ncbi:uncharacterized protein [Apostichopus japonicus]|uniref:uncharacterized protein isoform X1 n=2 Tax=Stichopus japonicus TaxID=307972 RepID=UPI003AB31CB4
MVLSALKRSSFQNMIGHALSDQCELPRSMDFNGNTWKRTHLEPQRKSDIDKTCPELSKLLDSDHLDGEIAAKSRTAVQVLPTSVQKVFRLESMEWTSSSHVNSDQRRESSHANQVTCDGTSSSTQSLHEDQVLNGDVSSSTQSLHGVQATSDDPSSSTQSLRGVQATSDDLSLSTQSLHENQVLNDDPSPSTPHGGKETVDGTSCSTLSWHSNQDKNDGLSSSTHSSHANQTSDKPEKSSSNSVMLKTFSDSGGTQIVSSNSRRKTRPQHATKNCQMTDISDGPQSNKENTSLKPPSPIELQMSCSEDDLDESQLDVKKQYLAAMMEHKAQMEEYMNEMEQYFCEKHGLNNKKEAASSVSEPDVLINISRGVQATPVEPLEKDIHINPALELDLSSSGSNKSNDGDNYKHEIDEGSLLVSNASPVVIHTTQTRMHLTNSTPRNRFQRTISPLTSTSAISKSVNDSPGTQVLAELEKVCKNIPSVSKRSTPPVLTSELEVPTLAQVKTVATGKFGSPHQSDMTTTQHNHPLLSPPVGIMQSSGHANLPQLVQMSDQSTGRALPLYQQHRGGKRLYPSSSNSPGSSTSTGHQSPENIGRVPDQGTPRYPAFLQLFRGVRPYHQPYPPAVRFPGSSCSNVQSNVRFPEPNTARFPEPNTARFPEPNTARYPEPNTARFPEPNGMRFPFPHYRAPGRAHNHMYPAGTGSVGISEPNVHSFSSGVLASRRRRQSSGSKQSASPPVSAPHNNINVSQCSHTIKYKPQDSVASHFERTYQEIMLRQNNYPRSPNVTVRHPWQQVPLSSAGIRTGLQPPPRNSYLRDQLTTPSRWPYNQRPIAQNFPPRIRQPSSYSHLLNSNTRGTSFNQQTPSGNSDWVNCLSTNNKTMEARPNPSTVPGSFDHQQQTVRSRSQLGSQSASPPSQLPSPMNHMPPENHFQPSHVPLTRLPVRNLNHVPPLISVSEPISHTPVAATAPRHSPNVPARTANLPSIYSYLAQNNAQSVMPQIASIQGVPSAKDPASSGGAVHPNRHQEPVMPRITRVHSTEMVPPDDEMVLDLSHRDKRTVMPQISQVRSQSERSISFGISQTLEQSEDPVPMMPKIVTVMTENCSATYQDGGTIPEGITSFREDQQDISGSKRQEMLPGSNPALMIPSVSIRGTHDENGNGNAPISRDLSTLPCNVDLANTYTPDLPNSSSENILSIPKLTGRARAFPIDEPTSGHLAPRHSFTNAKEVSNDGKYRSHSRKRKRKKHEDKTKPKKKKSYHHHHHDHAEAKSNYPALLKIPNVRKALREQSASGIVLHEWSMNQVREERNSLTSSKASSDDRGPSAPEDLSNSSVKELQTNTSVQNESASVNNVSSSMTVQAAPENLNVASNQIASLSSVVPSSVSLAVVPTSLQVSTTPVVVPTSLQVSTTPVVVPTSLQVSTTPVKQSCLPTIAPKQPLILQGILSSQIVVPSNITLIKQNNIVMGPILQVSISNQISQNFSILSSDQTPKTCAEVSNLEKGERSNEEKNAKALDVTNAISSVEGTKKVGSQENDLTIECYEETLEETANVDSSTTREISPDNEEVTITLPIPEASKPAESESQQTDDQGKHLTQAGEEVNLFDRVATYMSNLEKENDKARKSNPKPTKVTASANLIKAGERLAKTSGLKKGDGQQTSVRLKNCTLRLVPRKQRDDTVAGKTNRGKQERVRHAANEPPTSKDKAEAAKWDKYYGFREGRLPQHQHNTRFRIVCYHCENMMSDNVTYMDHVESVIEKSCPASKIKQLCKICFQTQTTGMAKHIVDCHPVDGKFCCKICNIHFPLRKDFKFHMKRVHKGLTMPYVCKICLYQTSFHSDLRQHFISKHRGSKALLCHFCTKILYSSRSFLAHFTKHYARESGVSCPSCILLFLSNSACKEHMANDHQMLESKESDGRPKLEVCQPQRKANSADKPSCEVTKRISPKTVEVIEITEIEEEEEVNKTWKCLECGGTYAHLEEHLITEYCCQNCRYHTQCSSAYSQHVVSFHSSFQDAPILHPVKKSQVFGGHLLKCRKCEFKTSFATNMAEHIVCCPKGVSVLDSFAYLRKKALDEIALRGKLGKVDDDGEPDVISVDMLID